MLKYIKKYFLLFFGSLFLLLGVIGIFLPVMPTTPFLLLTSYCYLRSSKKLYNWLINHKVLGAYIYNYITYRAMPQKTKIISITFLWGGLFTSMLLVNHPHIRLLLLAVGIGVSIHLLKLKTIQKADMVKPTITPAEKQTL